MNPSFRYRSDIDGLRAIAVLAVLFNHLSAPLLPGGYVGVDIFFVISGYLITSIISHDIASGRFAFSQFYERRIRRIFPALYVVLIVTIVAGYMLLLPSDYTATLRGAVGAIFFSSNMIFWRDMAAGYFAATDAMINPLLHTWSLGVEEQFYVFFPLMLLLCLNRFRRYAVQILILCTLLSLAAAILLVKNKSVAVFFLSPFRAWELLVGVLLTFDEWPKIHGRKVREVVAALGLMGILAPCFLYNDRTIFPGLAALPPVLGAAAIIYAGANGSSLVGRLLQLRPVVYVGLISYSLYLWHWPLIVFGRYAANMMPITAQYAVILFTASLMFASFSYHFIEQPFRRGRVFARPIIFSSAATIALILAVVSAIGISRDGFATRFDSAVIQLDQARYPKIPYVNCDGLSVAHECVLGQANKKPNVLLWGDSHLLAWGPVLNSVLLKQTESAVFVPNSACPPLFIDGNIVKDSCQANNDAVKNYLLSHPDIKTVVMAAYWSTYFRDEGPLVNNGLRGAAAAKSALINTVQWLQKNEIRIVLIGPVPTYDRNVPLALALDRASGHDSLESTKEAQYMLNAPFFGAIKSLGIDSNLSFLDPIQWMCAPDCVVMQGGLPLYRDAHHLSVLGAMSLKANLKSL